ncbi:hypothetical protein bthur0009_55170 [Bacillus thuringiensis serovar andalousiensis BGSC 4AW1]|nr:hypothetical protein bthur0009_55170 [Bacillus thuringiensis serovar andalousiensis BGSC 4AW1]
MDKSEFDKDFMINVLESNTVPTFIINPESENNEVLRGFDENIGRIMKALGL